MTQCGVKLNDVYLRYVLVMKVQGKDRPPSNGNVPRSSFSFQHIIVSFTIWILVITKCLLTTIIMNKKMSALRVIIPL